MHKLNALIRRNTKLFFKDKGVFFTSLITPLILLVLYATFLAKVYRDSFLSSIPAGFSLSDGIVNGLVGGQLLSSLLAVSCVTVPFCANMMMVSDKVNGALRDMTISPVKSSTLALGYYISTLISSLIISIIAMGGGMIYLSVQGWYLSVSDVLLMLLDVFLLVMFGTALSSVINFFLTTQGQISAVGTIVSSGYGFICGAYMPISNFGEGLQRVLSFLPGTYATSLLRNHTTRGVLSSMSDEGVPENVIDMIRDGIDCNIYFFDNSVSNGAMYVILVVSVVVLISGYILLNVLSGKRHGKVRLGKK